MIWGIYESMAFDQDDILVQVFVGRYEDAIIICSGWNSHPTKIYITKEIDT